MVATPQVGGPLVQVRQAVVSVQSVVSVQIEVLPSKVKPSQFVLPAHSAWQAHALSAITVSMTVPEQRPVWIVEVCWKSHKTGLSACKTDQ